MEEDYELTNAREWDDSLNVAPEEPPRDDSGWQVAGRSNKKAPQQKIHLRSRNTPIRGKSPAKAATGRGRPHNRFTEQRPNGATAKFNQTSIRLPRAIQSPVKQESHQHTSPVIVTDADNGAQIRWREHKPPAASVRIPADLALQDRTFEALAFNEGAFVHCEEFKNGASFLNFGIWGDPDEVAAAKKAILDWVKATTATDRGTGAAKWAKVVSLTLAQRHKHEKRWAREVRQQRYRQYPPHDMAFGAIGSFHWPTEEYRPEEIFGMSCEALDPIRMGCSCYVVYLKDRSLFQIMGKAQNVRTALFRMRNTSFQIMARLINPIRGFMLHWHDQSYVPTHIYQEKYYHTPVLFSDDEAQGMFTYSPRAKGMIEDGKLREVARTSSALSVERVKLTLANALQKLHYYRGHLQMRIRLGTFLMTSYMPPLDGLYGLEEYEAMTRESMFFGEVTDEIGEPKLEKKALEVFQHANNLLIPQDAITKSLISVKPIYSAIFTFADEAGDLRLFAAWDEVLDTASRSSDFEPRESKWTRFQRDAAAPTKLLNVSLTDLHTAAAWQFEILVADSVDSTKLPAMLQTFASSVRIDAAAATRQRPSESFVLHKPVTTLKSVRQIISYRYNVRETDYTLELTRFQDRIYPKRKSLVENVVPKAYTPRWGVNVYRVEWDNLFAKNERLAVGDTAEWDDDLEDWFPGDIGPNTPAEKAPGEDCFTQLMQKLERIEKLVREPCAGEDVDNDDDTDETSLVGGLMIS